MCSARPRLITRLFAGHTRKHARGYLCVVYSRAYGLEVFVSSKRESTIARYLRMRHGSHHTLICHHFANALHRLLEHKCLCQQGMTPKDALYELAKQDMIDNYIT